MTVVDGLLDLVNKVAPGGSLRFTKYYIGLEYHGQARNFASFAPTRQFVTMKFKLSKDDDTDGLIDDSGLHKLAYNATFGLYQVRIQQDDLNDEQRRKALSELIKKADDAY